MNGASIHEDLGVQGIVGIDTQRRVERIGTAGAFRSSRTDRGAQVLPPAGATVPPWLPAKSAHVSNLPACCALAGC
jgi:hypothetical protein